MDAIYDLKPYVGCKIQLNIKDEAFSGILSFVDPSSTKIGLHDVEELPSHEKLLGLQVFYSSDVINYSIIDKQKRQRNKSSKASIVDLMKCPAKKKNDYSIFLDSELSDEEDEQNLPICDVEDEEEYVLQLPEAYEDFLPKIHEFIDVCDEIFHDAIKHIFQEPFIGVAFEGNDVSRFGDISIISISTSRCTFLFDICTLKEEAFKHGLKDVFENPAIEKVIHDCRYPADALFHLYNTKLVQVFDTAASHLYIREIHQRYRKLKPYEWSLTWSLEQHLKLRREDMSRKYFSSVKTITDWTYRPLRNALRDRAIHNVIYLKLLREICITKMLAEFYKVVNVFNEVIRDCTEDELQLQETDFDFLPMKYAGVRVKIGQVSQYFRGDRKNPFSDFLKNICENGLERPVTESSRFPVDISDGTFIESPSYTSLLPRVRNSQGILRWGTPRKPDESSPSPSISECISSHKDDSITSSLPKESEFHKPSSIISSSKSDSVASVTLEDEPSGVTSSNEQNEETLQSTTTESNLVPYIPAGYEIFSTSERRRVILQNIGNKYSPQNSDSRSWSSDQSVKTKSSISLNHISFSGPANEESDVSSAECKKSVSDGSDEYTCSIRKKIFVS